MVFNEDIQKGVGDIPRLTGQKCIALIRIMKCVKERIEHTPSRCAKKAKDNETKIKLLLRMIGIRKEIGQEIVK